MKRKVELYNELLAIVRRTLRYAEGALAATQGRDEALVRRWRQKIAHYRDLTEAVVRQTVRRVVKGEKVPSEEKVVSLFEPHTDIIRKGGRRVRYGQQAEPGCGFRRIPISDSDGFRSVIPIDSDHLGVERVGALENLL